MIYKTILTSLVLLTACSIASAQTIEDLIDKLNEIQESKHLDSMNTEFDELAKLQENADYQKEPLDIRGVYTGYQCADIYKRSVALQASLNGSSSNALMLAIDMAYSDDSLILRKVDKPFSELVSSTQKAIENLDVLKSISKIYDTQDDEMSTFHFAKLKEGIEQLNDNFKTIEDSLTQMAEIMKSGE